MPSVDAGGQENASTDFTDSKPVQVIAEAPTVYRLLKRVMLVHQQTAEKKRNNFL